MYRTPFLYDLFEPCALFWYWTGKRAIAQGPEAPGRALQSQPRKIQVGPHSD